MAKDAIEARLIEQNDMILELNKLIVSLQKTIDNLNNREATLLQEIENLKEQNALLSKKLFGKSSEKSSWDLPGQYNLFNEAEASQDPSLLDDDQKESETETVTFERKKRSNNADRFNSLPVVKRYLDIPEDERICGECGTALEKIGTTFVRRELEFRRASFRVIEYYSVNYKCPDCTPDTKQPQIVKGSDGKAHMLYGMASSSTVAYIMYQKYANAMPLYRMERDFKQYGAVITRATLANWIIQNTEHFLIPFCEYLHGILLKRDFTMGDETPVQVLKEEGRRPESKSYMWLFRSGEDGDNPLILYKYAPSRSGDVAASFLKDYEGYFMCDGFSGYNKLTKAKRTCCWAHVRRYLIDAIPNGKKMDYALPAVQGVMYVDKLFHLEKTIKAKYKNDFDAIKKARLEKELPVLEGFWSWLEKQQPVKGSKFEKAVTYIRNRQPYLSNYLENGRCSFSNNLSEIEIKPVALGRKNYLFSDTPAGAEASAALYSVIETARANGLDIQEYLCYLLDELPLVNFEKDSLEKYLPWSLGLREELEKRAKERIEE